VDASKDQSYVLFGVGQQQLAHMLMPVGGYSKDKIRQFALDAGFPNANKADSQDICFIPLGDYREFLSQRLDAQPGRIVDTGGNVLGEHQGVHLYTVGQRRGLGVQAAHPLYVVAIDAEAGDVVVGLEEELYSPTLWASNVNYVGSRPPEGPTEVTVKVRYKSSEARAILHPEGSGALVRFETPQRALTPGQAAVFYQGERVLGGGYIETQRAPVVAG
jgi:tRNA-specific 2-thiouridylase